MRHDPSDPNADLQPCSPAMNGSFKNLFAEIREGLAYKQSKVKLDFTIQLETLMKQNGVTEAELSRKIEKSGPYIKKVMKGENNLTIESMVALADAVGGKIELHITPKDTVYGQPIGR